MVEISPKKKRQYHPKTQPYQKVNSYTQRPSKQQILTAIIFLGLLCVHEIFITTSVNKVQQAILWTLLAFRYVVLMLIIYDYIKLTIKDPVDRLIIDPSRRYKFNAYELRKCSICATTVQCSSHHCMTCNRCTEDFDHHCKYLNNCIGVRNYEQFIRILFTFVFFSLLGIFMGVWMLVQNSANIYISQANKWVIVGYIVLQGILILIVGSLLGFHLYISCCANITTLEFIMAPKNDVKPSLNVIVIQPSPLSAEHFTKTLQKNQNQYRQGQNQNRNFSGNPQDQYISNSQAMEYYRK